MEHIANITKLIQTWTSYARTVTLLDPQPTKKKLAYTCQTHLLSMGSLQINGSTLRGTIRQTLLPEQIQRHPLYLISKQSVIVKSSLYTHLA